MSSVKFVMSIEQNLSQVCYVQPDSDDERLRLCTVPLSGGRDSEIPLPREKRYVARPRACVLSEAMQFAFVR